MCIFFFSVTPSLKFCLFLRLFCFQPCTCTIFFRLKASISSGVSEWDDFVTGAWDCDRNKSRATLRWAISWTYAKIGVDCVFKWMRMCVSVWFITNRHICTNAGQLFSRGFSQKANIVSVRKAHKSRPCVFSMKDSIIFSIQAPIDYFLFNLNYIVSMRLKMLNSTSIDSNDCGKIWRLRDLTQMF